MMNLLNLSILLINFSYGEWIPQSSWYKDSSGYNTITYYSELDKIGCRDGMSLAFPNLMHSIQEVYLDGRLVYKFGDKKNGFVRSIYGAPVIDCALLTSGNNISWVIYSPIEYFSKIRNMPTIEPGTSQFRHSDLKHFAIYGALFVFALMLFLGPKTTNLRKQSIYLGAFSTFMATFFFLSVSGYFGFNLNYLFVDKLAVISLGAAVICFNNFLYQRKLIGLWVMRIFVVVSFLGIIAVPFASDGDKVQGYLNIIFGPALCSVWLSIFNELNLKSLYSLVKRTEFFALSSFAAATTSDIFYTLGLHNGGMYLGYGVLGAIYFFSRSLQIDISSAYNERDYLRQNLEKEVQTKTNSLNAALNELKLTQAELIQNAKLASLGTLSAGIAHEINNSINYVNACLMGLDREIKKKDLINFEKVDKLILTIKHGTSMTIDIVNSLRNFTGLNQAKMKEIDLREVVQSVKAIIKRKLDKVNIEEKYSGDITLMCNVVGLNQLFMNLITNSIDAVDKENGKINIVISNIGNAIEIHVIDNGSGIPNEIVDKIFDPFFTTKEVGSGTGLGLYIVKKEVDAHQGKIFVKSSPSGTEFIITLPKAVQQVGAA